MPRAVEQPGKSGICPDHPRSVVIIPHFKLQQTGGNPCHCQNKPTVQITAPVVNTIFTPQLNQRTPTTLRENLIEPAAEAHREIVLGVDRIAAVHRPEGTLVDFELYRLALLRDFKAARRSRPPQIDEISAGSSVDQRRAVVVEQIVRVVEFQYNPVRRIHGPHRIICDDRVP